MATKKPRERGRIASARKLVTVPPFHVHREAPPPASLRVPDPPLHVIPDPVVKAKVEGWWESVKRAMEW
jgi:hypothetical protein